MLVFPFNRGRHPQQLLGELNQSATEARKKHPSSVSWIPRPPQTFVLYTGHIKQMQDSLWHCAGGGRGEKVQGKIWPGNVRCLGCISKACAKAVVKYSVLANFCQKSCLLLPSLHPF